MEVAYGLFFKTEALFEYFCSQLGSQERQRDLERKRQRLRSGNDKRRQSRNVSHQKNEWSRCRLNWSCCDEESVLRSLRNQKHIPHRQKIGKTFRKIASMCPGDELPIPKSIDKSHWVFTWLPGYEVVLEDALLTGSYK